MPISTPRDARGPRALRVVLILVGMAGAAALAAYLWRDSAGPPGSPPIPAAPPAQAPDGGGAEREGAGNSRGPRDLNRDRELTASEEAFRIYAEGMGLWRSQPMQAAAKFRRVVLLDTGFAPAHYRLALTGLLLARRDEAASEVQAAMKNQERLPDPYRTVAPVLTHFVAGAFDLVHAALPEAMARQRADADLQLLAGLLCAWSCDHFDPNGAVEHLEEVLSVEPRFPVARAAVTTAYGMKGMNDWSLTRALEYRSLQPQLSEAVATVGIVRTARGEYGDAIEAADEVVRRGEDVYSLGLAPAFILTGHNEQVAAMYDPEAERRLEPAENVRTHLHAGINKVWLGRFGDAIEHFERGAEFMPGPWQRSGKSLFFLLAGRTHALLGRTKEADAALEAAQQVVGPRPVLEYCLGVNKLRAGSLEEAQRAARRLAQEVRSSQPGWNEPWRRLLEGEIALAAGDTTSAIDQFREAWRLGKPLDTDCIVEYTDAFFLDALGRGSLASGRAQDALQAFEQIRALGVKGLHQPEITVLALYRSGRALEMLDRIPEAHARYRQFLDLWGGAEGPPGEVIDARARLMAGKGEIQ